MVLVAVAQGTPLLSQFEDEIHQGFTKVGLPTAIKRFGVFSFLMTRLTELHRFDVILVDCSPSNSAINKAAALACHYILPPCQVRGPRQGGRSSEALAWFERSVVIEPKEVAVAGLPTEKRSLALLVPPARC